MSKNAPIEYGVGENKKEKELQNITKREYALMTISQKEDFENAGRAAYDTDIKTISNPNGEGPWKRKRAKMNIQSNFTLEQEDNKNFNINNYEIDELYDLLALQKDTATKTDIDESVQDMKDTLDKNSDENNQNIISTYKTFFTEAGDTLKEFIDNNKTPLRTGSQIVQTPNLSKIRRAVLSCRDTIVINSNRVPREIKTTICPDNTFTFKPNRYRKTNFEVFLEFKLKDSLKMALGNVTIPMAGYFSIDPAYNTNNFTVYDISNSRTICIELETQQPRETEYTGFLNSIHRALAQVNIFDLSFNINDNSKFFIKTDNPTGYRIDWLGGDCDSMYCVGTTIKKPNKFDRPESTLGYLLGFDTTPDENNQSIITIKKDQPAIAIRGCSGIKGTNGFWLELTDYTGNSQNHNTVTISKPIQNFKQPYYFQAIKNRIGIDSSLNFCEKYTENHKRPKRKGTNNNSLFNNDLDKLTQARKYTILSHQAANNGISVNSGGNSGVGSSGGGRIGGGGGPGGGGSSGGGNNHKTMVFYIQRRTDRGGPPGSIRQPIQFSGSRENICPIVYNGKTDIIKLGIALKDDNDFLIDLHGSGIIITWNTDAFFETPDDKRGKDSYGNIINEPDGIKDSEQGL